MQRLCRFIRRSFVPMAFILPLWLTVGRAMFSVGGWDVLIYLFFFAPILLVSMLIIGFAITGRPDVKASGLVSPKEAVLISAMYVAVLAHGFFSVGFGDTDESYKSVATQLFGRDFLDISNVLSEFFFWASFVLVPVCVAVAIVERVKAFRRAHK